MERKFEDYIGKTLRDFLLNETEDTINGRTVWICVGDMWHTLICSDYFTTLLQLGSGVKISLINDIIADNMDITIVIKNPFEGAD